MARNKTVSRSTRTKNSIQPDADFMSVPAKLAARLEKDILIVKKNENKLKNLISKAQTQLKKSEQKLKLASKNSSPNGKKQFNIVKKSRNASYKALSQLDKQLATNNKLLTKLLSEQAKFVALGKYLNQFEKEWAKKSKIGKTKPRNATRAKKSIVKPVTNLDNVNQFPVAGDGTLTNNPTNEPSEIAA